MWRAITDFEYRTSRGRPVFISKGQLMEPLNRADKNRLLSQGYIRDGRYSFSETETPRALLGKKMAAFGEQDFSEKSVSVIVPVKDSPKMIFRALESIENQTIKPKEVLVGIDSCASTKNALESSWVDMNVQAFYFQEHVGCYVVRNTLAEKATSNVLSFFDADDTMLPYYLDSMLRLLDERSFVRSLQAWVRDGQRILTHDGKKTHMSMMQIVCWRLHFMALNGCEPWMCNADKEFVQRLGQHNLTEKRVGFENMIRYKTGRGITELDTTGYSSALRKALNSEIRRRAKNPKSPDTLTTANCVRIF